jgi:hypothetical protein
MENQPIIFGRNITTNAITQIRTIGNTLLTTAGNINDLDDVVITTPTNNQVLKYTSPNWINDFLGLGDLLNVSIASLAIGQFLRFNGTIWQNVSRDYITINMYGTTSTTLHSNTTPKPIMAGISAYWSTIPNPATNTNGSMTSRTTPFSSVFDTTTGFITLNANKEYMITATINQGGVNLNASCQTELSIYNASSGTAVAFTPNYTNIGRMDIDFAGMGITTTAVVGTGITKIAVMFRYLTAQSTGLNPLDTSITVSIIEL